MAGGPSPGPGIGQGGGVDWDPRRMTFPELVAMSLTASFIPCPLHSLPPSLLASLSVSKGGEGWAHVSWTCKVGEVHVMIQGASLTTAFNTHVFRVIVNAILIKYQVVLCSSDCIRVKK